MSNSCLCDSFPHQPHKNTVNHQNVSCLAVSPQVPVKVSGLLKLASISKMLVEILASLYIRRESECILTPTVILSIL